VVGAKALNLVECIGDNLEQLQQQVNQICHRIQSDRSGQATGYYLAQTGEEIASLWELRKRGVGLLGNAGVA
jgi:FAD/FMN-containing dehydrogenase